MPLATLLDRYFYNEHTLLMIHIDPAIEEKYPEIWRWFEVKDRVVVKRLRAAGAVVYSCEGHFWLGVPRDRELFPYLTGLLT